MANALKTVKERKAFIVITSSACVREQTSPLKMCFWERVISQTGGVQMGLFYAYKLFQEEQHWCFIADETGKKKKKNYIGTKAYYFMFVKIYCDFHSYITFTILYIGLTKDQNQDEK